MTPITCNAGSALSPRAGTAPMSSRSPWTDRRASAEQAGQARQSSITSTPRAHGRREAGGALLSGMRSDSTNESSMSTHFIGLNAPVGIARDACGRVLVPAITNIEEGDLAMAQPAKFSARQGPELPPVPFSLGRVTHLVPVVSSSPANDPECPTSDYYWRDVLEVIPGIPEKAMPSLARKFALAVREAIDASQPTFPRRW